MPGCGNRISKDSPRCGDIIAGIRLYRCRACAYAQDGEKETRREHDRDDGRLHRGGKKKPRSSRRQARM